MKKGLTIKEIWKAIDSGKTVCWSSEAYEVHPIDNNNTEYSEPTARGEEALRCSCIYNYFGSYLAKSEFRSCFIVDKKPTYTKE